MKLFDCNKCLLVESGPDGQQKIEEIEWDEEKFNRVVLNKLEKGKVFFYFQECETRIKRIGL